MNETPSRIDLAVFAYLTIPTLLFFLTFITPWIGWPAAIFLLCIGVSLAINSRQGSSIETWKWAYIVCLAAGYGRFFPENSDWVKHYAITNALAENQWPVVNGGDVMRYALGWYLIPALAMKVFGGGANLYLSIWTFFGVVLVFRMIVDMFPGRTYAWLAPLVFMIFSGADIVGTWITHYQSGPLHHLEWWSGWGEYPSSVTSIFWTPQHALPAWLMGALIMRQCKVSTMHKSLPALFFTTCFWSPFAAIGVIPFFLALIARQNIRPFLSWRALASVILIGVPIAYYLLSGTSSIPHGLASGVKCTAASILCFSTPTYFLFVAVECMLFSAVLFAVKSERRGMLLIATITLVIYPFIHFGAANDLMMRASIAPLAVIAILVANALSSRGPAARAALTILLLAGIATPAGEVARAFAGAAPINQGSELDAPSLIDPRARSQYFAHLTPLIRLPF